LPPLLLAAPPPPNKTRPTEILFFSDKVSLINQQIFKIYYYREKGRERERERERVHEKRESA
jgi:hypothetical protein